MRASPAVVLSEGLVRGACSVKLTAISGNLRTSVHAAHSLVKYHPGAQAPALPSTGSGQALNQEGSS